MSKRKDGSEVDPVVEAFKKDVDRTLIRRNLSLTYEERILQLIELQDLARELRRAGRELEPQNR